MDNQITDTVPYYITEALTSYYDVLIGNLGSTSGYKEERYALYLIERFSKTLEDIGGTNYRMQIEATDRGCIKSIKEVLEDLINGEQVQEQADRSL